MLDGDELIASARKFERNLLNFFWRQGVSYSDGNDLVQETYIRLWRYRDRYVESAKLSTFLFTLARQVRLDALKRTTRRDRRERAWYDGKSQSDEGENRRFDAREDIRWALSRLSDAQREVIELGVLQEFTYAQIAQILEIPLGTVKSRMSNALKKLKEVFDDDGSQSNAH